LRRLGRRRSRALPAAADRPVPTVGPHELSLAERYLALAFGVGKHEPTLVGSYYGPPEPEAAEPLEPSRLVEEARSLLADLERSDLAPERRRWIAAQTQALLTIARRLAGERFSYADEVEGVLGIQPRWYDEAAYERAHELLAEALPGTDDLGDRYRRWLEQTAVPQEKLLPALRAVLGELRARTEALVGLPEGESLELEVVSGERWLAFNRRLGDLRSRISINTDARLPAVDLAYVAAHEGYPGHHAHGSWREQALVRERGWVEVTLSTYAQPQAVLSEGVAELGADLVLDDGGQELVTGLGFDYDREVGASVFEARRLLRTVSSNVTLLVHERGASLDEAADYMRRWSLEPENRVENAVESIRAHPFPGYLHCYPEGRRLCAGFARGDPQRFKRLLVEQLVPADLSPPAA
jgi:hypothetical protein